MLMRRAALLTVLSAMTAIVSAAQVRMYNTAKQKLAAGKQLVGATVLSPDANIYCAMANAGYDLPPDIGALGIIVPTVDTVEKAEAAVKWSKYPPQGCPEPGQQP